MSDTTTQGITTRENPTQQNSTQQLTTHKSFCRFCHVFCGVEVDVVDGRAVALRGDPDNEASRGYTCMKGRAELERLYHPDRLLGAQLRGDDGALHPAGTAEALDEVARRLAAIMAEHGPDSVAVYTGCGGHRSAAGGPWFVRRWLDALGSRRMYTNFTIDSPSMIVAATRLFGAAMPLMLLDIEHADVAMFVGTNPLTSHFVSMPQPDPRRRLNEARRRGMRLIVIDPRRSEVARLADHHLQVRPGEDATLLAGMIRTIITENLVDRDYLAAHARGLDALAAAVAPFDPDYVAERTGVDAAETAAAARTFATAPTGGVTTGTGLHMARHQNLSTQLAMTFNVLCGRYDRRGGMTRHAGAVNAPVPELDEPVTMPVYDPPKARIRDIAGSFNWLGFFEELPTATLTDEILTPGDDQVRALIVHGGNPALVFADAESTGKALDSLELLVVNDLFMTATARRADAVFAMAHPFERPDIPRLGDGTFPFAFSQYTPALVEPPEGVLEDWEMFWELADRLDLEWDLPGLTPGVRPTTDELIAALNPDSRVPFSEIRPHQGGHRFGEVDPLVGGIVGILTGHPANPMALDHPEVLAELAEVRGEPVLGGGGFTEGEEHGFRMITYRMKEAYCTQGQNLPSLARRRDHNPVLMNPADLVTLGITDGSMVALDSGYGRVEGQVEASEDVAPGVVACAFGWGGPENGGTNVQYLIPDDVRYDPVTGLAQQSAVPIDVIPLH